MPSSALAGKGNSRHFQKRWPVQQDVNLAGGIGILRPCEQKTLAVGADNEMIPQRKAQANIEQRLRSTGFEFRPIGLDRNGHELGVRKEKEFLAVGSPQRHGPTRYRNLPPFGGHPGPRRGLHKYLRPPRFLGHVCYPAAVGRELTVVRPINPTGEEHRLPVICQRNRNNTRLLAKERRVVQQILSIRRYGIDTLVDFGNQQLLHSCPRHPPACGKCPCVLCGWS